MKQIVKKLSRRLRQTTIRDLLLELRDWLHEGGLDVEITVDDYVMHNIIGCAVIAYHNKLLYLKLINSLSDACHWKVFTNSEDFFGSQHCEVVPAIYRGRSLPSVIGRICAEHFGFTVRHVIFRRNVWSFSGYRQPSKTNRRTE